MDNNLIFRELDIPNFERVVEIKQIEARLHAIIAIHSTKLGPALGGTRAYPYSSFDAALNDVLRLARGMTYKAGIAQTGTGGAKSVIILDPAIPRSDQQLLAFADAVNQFNCQYICAEDVGMSVADLAIISRRTPYAVGLPFPKSSGDPSPYTAFGGLKGIHAVCQHLWKTPSVAGKTLAIQGLGAVGMKLANYLFWEGARLIVADVDPEKTSYAVKQFGAQGVSPEDILRMKCDILVPCAMGGVLNKNTIPHLRCHAVAGLANNQLWEIEDSMRLLEKNILYAPDFVINGGGLRNVCLELQAEGYQPVSAHREVSRIYDVLLEIFEMSHEKKLATNQVAEDIVDYNLQHGIGKRTQPVVFHHATRD